MTAGSSPDSLADFIRSALPTPAPREDDRAYLAWFTELVSLVERHKALPIAYADYFDASEGWSAPMTAR